MDEKGRLKIPAVFLEDLRKYGNQFYITSTTGESARIYPMQVWIAIEEKLAKVSGILLAYSSLKVAVEGHTDSVGSDEFNQALSERRAQAVRDYLVQQGATDSMITFRGLGKTQPIASNDTPDGRQRNRRVELVVSGDAIGVSAKGPETQQQ